MARLLVVDDEPQMLSAYKATFSTFSDASPAWPLEDGDLDVLSEQLFSEPAKPKDSPHDFDVQYCSQGDEAARKVEEALASGQPFSVILLDMRMPPGIDGKETARRVRALDRDVNIVIVTGYSDHSPHTVAEVAGPIDKLFYITKPFDRVEIRQLAISLDARWRLEQELRRSQKTVAEKLELLEQAYVQLSINEAHARHASLHDPLTGLLNRTGFSQHVNQVLQSGQHVTVLFLDLDHFKNVNDTLGHQVGDILVRDVASAMSAVLPSPACIARLGGDEFGICLSTSRPELVETVCDQLLAVCSQALDICGHRVQVSASIGIAASGAEEMAEDTELLRRADQALYAAKRDGRNKYCWFRLELDENIRLRAELEMALREALANDELSLVYQPITEQPLGQIVGFEALVRWENAKHGSLSPSLFIPIAEEAGIIHSIGRWIIQRAVQDCTSWVGQYVSINLSPAQFTDIDLADYLKQVCVAAGLPPALVQLEITETTLFSNFDRAKTTITSLRQIGFRIALDDFGTGYSSLVHLKEFALDCIKIDRSFVAEIGKDMQTEAIVRSVAALARSLGMSVVAEGVESALQEQALRRAGCSHMQGFHIGRPADARVTLDRALTAPLSHQPLGSAFA